jgi:hypothetical protein
VNSGPGDDAVKGLWGGELPGLWNRLTAHQDRRAAFRLVRFEVPPTREGVARIALVRRQEIDGFVEGLFGSEESIDLPERAHQALKVLYEMRALHAGTASRDEPVFGNQAATAMNWSNSLPTACAGAGTRFRFH